ncbi:uncharacterized protein si:dkey-97a13.12 isoform X2 [Alosa alosa]|uniref:uncharacterized protein si:dkey-97a13.12 isoform X2 n=1 Tax=Alosa alosa TaxID=278164 RepID=UPI00201534C5|nr:uncharacterized protein si:dkey-97a13.12 isoform X2 [Alosa alosa]
MNSCVCWLFKGVLAVCWLFKGRMQQIYRQSDEQVEVFTTVMSAQMCKTRMRQRHEDEEKVVVLQQYQACWPDEMDLLPGESVQVLLRDDTWCFGRLPNGIVGYFPTSCVTLPSQEEEREMSSPSVHRRKSVQDTTVTPCGFKGGRSLRLPRRALSLSAASGCSASPGLFQRMLNAARRHSYGPAHLLGSQNSTFTSE